MFDESVKPIDFHEEAGDNAGTQVFSQPSRFRGLEVLFRTSLGNRARILFPLSLALNMILIDRLILSKVTSVEAFFNMTSTTYAYSSILLTILSATIFGITVAKMVMSTEKMPPNLSYLAWLQIAIGGSLMILSIGCPVCGSPVLTALRIPGGLEIFPLGGLELKVLSILLHWSSFRLISTQEKESQTLDDGISVKEQQVRNLPHQSLFKRIRPSLLPTGVILVVLSLPMLPPTWKVDFRNEGGSEYSLSSETSSEIDFQSLIEQVFPEEGYQINVNYGDIGPQLIEAGAIDFDQFADRYEKGGAPLTDEQIKILTEGLDEPIMIRHDNAHFLLNFFWALGLTNKNPILEVGPMMERSEGNIGRFASTGGWTLGQKDPTELYSSAGIILLTPEQQEQVEKVAAVVYRPCCNNPTIFPDCNHGMAMLGLLELLAANGGTEEQLLDAAKYFNAYWFPQQSLEVAMFFETTKGLTFNEVDAELAVGPQIFSGSGFQGVHAWLGENGLLKEGSSQGGSCGV